MDISVFISRLLYDHDCVIIPGFGGFVCNYQPAMIHPVQHTISPPSKAISFNRNLQANDGLLVNHIAREQHISLTDATQVVQQWVHASRLQLKRGEALVLRQIGVFRLDVEGNMQFNPDPSVNYLKSSYGLRTITAEPILRGKEIDFTEKFKQETKPQPIQRTYWRLAAAVLLLAAMGTVVQLMYSGVEIKPLNLDEAGVHAFISRIFKTEEVVVAPLMPSPVEESIEVAELSEVVSSESAIPPTTPDENTATPAPVNVPEAVFSTTDAVAAHPAKGYYIITGAFAEENNVEIAQQHLLEKHPASELFVERGRRLTKVGFYAGDNYAIALEKLRTARAEDASYWMLHK
jgi:hypothetical protein